MKRWAPRAPEAFEAAFEAVRTELNVPSEFPVEVLAEAEAATVDSGLDARAQRTDARHLPLVAIDPPGATDLDQAFTAERQATGGFRVWYAIADVAAFVRPGGAIDAEARARGTTLYSPDLRTPLHPPVISEDRASLLPGTAKPALLWTIDLDEDGDVVGSHLERAEVEVRESITYRDAQHRLAAGDETCRLLRSIGELRVAREIDRGGISLNLPSQEILEVDGTYTLVYDESLPVESWNAQLSLLTGMEAGARMLDARLGVLRTLPPAAEQDLAQLRAEAAALGLSWPSDQPYADFVRTVRSDTPPRAAFLLQAARSFRGAGYATLEGSVPSLHTHGAIASVYSHVTAPLRRLVDRFGNEILLALYADRTPPAWAVEALEELPKLMGRARSRESALERAMVDLTEAMLLERRLGQRFKAVVVDLDTERGRATVQLREPAIVTKIKADGLRLGTAVDLRLTGVDVAARQLMFEV